MNGEKSPLISIIIPSFNEEKYIARCLDSILNQTYSDLEVLCVDDNSTDSTFDIIKEYSVKDSRIKPFKNPEKGVSSARNFGIEKASGDYIGFVDSDDFIQPQMYEFLLRAINENNCEMVVCRYSKVSEVNFETFEYNCRECFAEEFIDFYNIDFIIKNELIVASACMKLIKKTLILKNEKFLQYKIGEDTVFCSNLWINTDKVFLIDLPLYCYFNNINSVLHSNNWDEKWFDLIETRFVASEILNNYQNKKISSFYLDRGIKSLLSFRMDIKNSESEKKLNKKINKYFLKYLPFYIKDENLSFRKKIYAIIFYIFPFVYKIFKKILKKTF